jgi:hypothetical protein
VSTRKTPSDATEQLPAAIATAAKKTGFSGEEYNRVAMSANLEAVQLLKLDFEAHPERFEVEDLKLSHGRKLLSCTFDEETPAAAAVFSYSVTAKHGRAKAFQCVAEYAVLYAMPNDAKPEAATAFCRHVGGFAAYPYFRALAAQMAWNAGLDLPPLPTIAAMPVMPKKAETPQE